MKAEDIFSSITEISDDMIEEARTTRFNQKDGHLELEKKKETVKKKRATHMKRWGVATVCAALAIIIGGTFLFKTGLIQSPGASSGGSGHEAGVTFMSYAGPVFPMSTQNDTEGVEVSRNIDFDFSPYQTDEESYTMEDGTVKTFDRYDASALVTDAYIFTNTTDEDKKLTLVYPVAASLQDKQSVLPVISADGTEIETKLHFGPYSGGFQSAFGDTEGESESLNLKELDSWEKYRALLESGDYEKRAFDEYPDLNQEVTVYEFSDSKADHEASAAPTIQMKFNLDATKTTILAYGFNGCQFDQENGFQAYNYFIPEETNDNASKSKYLIIIGDDIRDYTVQGYENGACEAGEEIEDATVNVTRYQTTFEEIMQRMTKEFKELYDNGTDDEETQILDCINDDDLMGLTEELLSDYGVLSEDGAERYDNGILEDLFSETINVGRVMYETCDIVIPAGQTINVQATMKKEASYDFYCGKSNDQNLNGYDCVTMLASTLSFDRQTASIQDHGIIEIVRQNFGFALSEGKTTVDLDPSEEHYYMEIRKIEK